jgi:hypothetical protein
MELNIAIRQGSVAMHFRLFAGQANTGLVSFEYEPSFLINKWDISPLKMPIFIPFTIAKKYPFKLRANSSVT